MEKLSIRPDKKYICDYIVNNEVAYSSEPYEYAGEARSEVRKWYVWQEGLPLGTTSSIYYIIEIPETWSGSKNPNNLFMGLRTKIGLTKNIKKRVQNLQTGSSGELVVCALEPGGIEREQKLHKLFESERRQGEWFVCTPKLTRHIRDTHLKNKMLPPKHVHKLQNLVSRASIYHALKKNMGIEPDLVNPALDEEWDSADYVFLDLVNGPKKRG